MLDNYGAMEGGVTRAAYEMLGNGQCVTKAGRPALVLDVGANFGYFALYAAKMGCRVVAWEPVPLFRAFLHHGIALNNLTHLVTVRDAAVSDNATTVAIGVPKDGTYYGLASVDNLNLMPHEVKATVHAPAERIDAVVKEPVLMLKLDVEGYEPHALLSASGLLNQQRIRHILLEYSPGIFERSRDFTTLSTLPLSLAALLKQGFVAGHLPMRIATPWPPKLMSEFYAEPFPVLEEVTPASLELDVRSVAMRQKEEGDGAQHKGCPVPLELKKLPVWGHCNEWAYAAHPKGFRSSFGFNTNLWLSRSFARVPAHSLAALAAKQGGAAALQPAASAVPTGVLRVAGQASLFAPDQDMKNWTSLANPGVSIGWMECDRLGSSHQVIFRCPCRAPQECGAEQALVQRLLALGKMPMQDW